MGYRCVVHSTLTCTLCLSLSFSLFRSPSLYLSLSCRVDLRVVCPSAAAQSIRPRPSAVGWPSLRVHLRLAPGPTQEGRSRDPLPGVRDRPCMASRASSFTGRLHIVDGPSRHVRHLLRSEPPGLHRSQRQHHAAARQPRPRQHWPTPDTGRDALLVTCARDVCGHGARAARCCPGRTAPHRRQHWLCALLERRGMARRWTARRRQRCRARLRQAGGSVCSSSSRRRRRSRGSLPDLLHPRSLCTGFLRCAPPTPLFWPRLSGKTLSAEEDKSGRCPHPIQCLRPCLGRHVVRGGSRRSLCRTSASCQ